MPEPLSSLDTEFQEMYSFKLYFLLYKPAVTPRTRVVTEVHVDHACADTLTQRFGIAGSDNRFKMAAI